MDKQEILEELKRKISYNIKSSEMSQEEINRIVKQCFNGLEKIFEEYHCSSNAISDYIYGNYINSKNSANEILQDRDEELIELANQKVNKMIKEVEEKGKIEGQNHKYELENLNLQIDDSKNTTKIINKVIDNLADIKAQVTRILYNKEYSDARIEQIMEDVNSYIRKVENLKGQEIYQILGQDGKQKVKDIANSFEEIEGDLTEKSQEGQENTMSEKASAFKSGLSSGISLEKQADNTEKILQDLEEKQKQMSENEKAFEGLRGDIIS